MISVLFVIGSAVLLRWFLSIAHKNLDYVGIGLSLFDKTDAYVFRLVALFFVIVINKWILYVLFSIRANLIFDVGIFFIFLFFGSLLIALRIQNWI